MNALKKFLTHFRGRRPSMIDRAPRVPLVQLHQIQFFSGPVKKATHVTNISITGLAITATSGNSLEPVIGQVIKGQLQIGEEIFQVDCEVRHRSEHALGCRFVDPSAKLKLAIQRYLEGELMGVKLRPVDPTYLKQEPIGECFWLTDGAYNEVYVHWHENRLLHFHVSFVGNYLEGGSGKPLRYGYLVAEDTGLKPYKESTIISMSPDIPEGILPVAQKLAKTLSGLPRDVKDKLVSALQP